MKFEPIAIVGQGCVLPGGLSPDGLWDTVRAGRDALGSAQPGYWGVSAEHILRDPKNSAFLDHTWSDRGGYVRGFDPALATGGFSLTPRLSMVSIRCTCGPSRRPAKPLRVRAGVRAKSRARPGSSSET